MSDPIDLSEIFALIDTPTGKKRVFDYLKTEPYPHFEESKMPGLLFRIDADGTRTLGRFVEKEFHPVRGTID